MFRKGSAVITALAVSALTSLLLTGAATYVMAYNVRVQREKDYQAALTLAEAGVNYELLFVSNNINTTGIKAHLVNNKYTGTIPGVEGNYVVWVASTDGSVWAPPKDCTITSIGTVGNISRQVTITGVRQGLFADYSVFGTENVTFNASGSYVEGTCGTNGVLVSSSVASAAVHGDIILAGPNATGPSGPNVYTEPDPVLWPTVDEIVNSTFTGGWSWLTNTTNIHRSNGNLLQWKANLPSTATLSPSNVIFAGWPATGAGSTVLSTSSFNGLNSGPGGGPKTLIFPPGDYLLTNIQISGGVKIIIDTAGLSTGTPGKVRIWMPSSGTTDQQDTINCNVEMTTDPNANVADADRLKFRLYYNKKAELSIAGSSTYYGGFYGVRADCLATITVTGGSLVNGSVIANTVKDAGGSIIKYPLPGVITDSDDLALWYGFGDRWKEAKLANDRKVFVDGTDD